MNEYQITAANIPTSTSIGASGREVIRIQPDGRIFWCGREVVGDEMFKAAMIDLLAVLKKHELATNKRTAVGRADCRNSC